MLWCLYFGAAASLSGMDFNNDIGSFGLPLIDESSRRAGGASGAKKSSKKKLKKLQNTNFMVHHHINIKSTTTPTTAATASTKMSKKKMKRLQKHTSNVPKEEIDNSSSSDDESLALSQLAVITNKPMTSNDGASRQHTNSNKVQRKDKKQVGLHSFLVKSTISDNMNTTTATDGSNKKRPHSFISAKSIIMDDNCVDVKSNVNYNDDIIDYFSDNNDEELASSIITDNKVQTTLDNNAVSSKDQEDVDITKELQQKQQMKQQKKLENRIQFGINNTIIGHNLPTRYGGSSNNNKKINVLSTLNQRMYLGGNKTHISNSIRQYVHSSKHYNICDTVNLSSSTTTNNNIGEVTTMSFDKDGILLATGDEKGNICIYDFDDVYSLDVAKRNEINKLYLKSQDEGDETDERDKVNDTNEGEDSRRESDETDNAPRRGSDSETDNALDEQSQQQQQQSTIIPSLANPILSFQSKTWLASRQGRNRPRISSVKWCPENQDHLLVSFANQSEVHIYDIASNKSPLPCLRVGGVDLTAPSRHRASSSEGILKSIFIPPKFNKKTQVITGGNYGTVQLWTIPPTIGSNSNVKSQWSISVFGSNGEGVCDLLSLPLLSSSSTSSLNNNTKKQKQQVSKQQSLVLVAGNGASLALLDTNRITRKAFSTKVSPTVAASWDIHQLAVREYAKIDSEAKLPNRKWMAGHQLTSLGHGSNRDGTWYKVGIVVKCGWVFVAEISLPSSSSSATNASSKISLQLKIVHHTPRIQCFNSLNEPLAILGGMALQFSLPDVPVPSSLAVGGNDGSSNMLWLGDVKTKRYTLPSKDKYVLCEDHGKVTSSQTNSSSSLDQGGGDGLILTNLNGDERKMNNNICASIPLSNGSPLSLAVHPSGEWIVVGYGNGGRMGGEKSLEILSMRKK